MQEIWKDVPEYEGLYQVSNLGSVRSLTHTRRSSNGKTARANGKVIKPLEQNGYLNIMLYKDGVRKRFRLHRLIASAFIPNPHNFPQVNHKDENKKTRTKRTTMLKILNGAIQNTTIVMVQGCKDIQRLGE